VGSLGTPEILVIFVVALIVLGPERLPNIARQMGKAMGEFRRMSSGFQDEIRKAIDDPADYTPSFPGGKPKPATPPAGTPGTSGAPADDLIGPVSGGPPSPHPIVPADTSELPPPPDDPSRN
jgi:sec-independent protein translocase protein TatB